MKIDTFFYPQPGHEEKLREKIIVVMDILRATSSIITALGNKAKAVVPVIEPEDAAGLLKRSAPGSTVTGGERKGFKIEGFDLGNSPLEYSETKVGGKIVILCTSNGTKAIKWAQNAGELLIGSFLNLQAVVTYLKERRQDTVLICSGREGGMSLEDLACAGIIVHALDKCINDLKKTDTAKAAQYTGQQALLTGLPEFIRQTEHGGYLKEIGMGEDLHYCATLNRYDILPKYNGGSIMIA